MITALVVALACTTAQARTENFIVTAPTELEAQEIASHAEHYRTTQFEDWFGIDPPPKWETPALVTVVPGRGAGATTFTLSRGRASDFRIELSGQTLDQILSSTLPHEVLHAVMATYTGRKTARWLDEGMASTVEDKRTKAQLRKVLLDDLRNRRRLTVRSMMSKKEYPENILGFYAQAWSVCQFIIEKHGRAKLFELRKNYFGDDGVSALQRTFGLTPEELQDDWMTWVKGGLQITNHVAVHSTHTCLNPG